MTVFLPQKGKSINDVLAQLDGNNWQPKCHQYMVNVKMPRFEAKTDLALEDIMAALGMPSAFISSVADFSNFCEEPTYISLMKQVARIIVDEEGTEAAAVTIIGDKNEAVEYADFHATHPFLYVISELSSGAIFFVGQYTGQEENGMGETDAIHSLECEPVSLRQQIFDLQGRKIVNGKSVNSKSPGVYIRDGRKFIVK